MEKIRKKHYDNSNYFASIVIHLGGSFDSDFIHMCPTLIITTLKH
jgi:hypothetical protein